MQTILDLDYHDNSLFGNGDLDSIKRTFNNAKKSGFDTILWAPMICGKAYYPSQVAKPISRSRHYQGSHFLDELLARFDPLEQAIKIAGEFDLELLFYFRLFDDFIPGYEDDFLSSRPDLWWQSRCGNYQFKGWPSYHQPEVRDYKLRLFKEQLAYCPSGFMIDLCRSHSWYFNPQRSGNFFGYEAPVAEEYQRRYGIDITAFDYDEFVTNAEGIYQETPYTYSVDYVNPAEFDLDAWHWLKGEAIDLFLRELRSLSQAAIPTSRLLMQGGLCPPHPGALGESAAAKFYIDANKLAADDIIDGYSQAANFRNFTFTPDIDSFFFPYFTGVREASKQVGGWLNDILTANGGHGTLAEVDEVHAYVECIKKTTLDYVIIHESDFVDRHPQSEAVWQALSGFKQ